MALFIYRPTVDALDDDWSANGASSLWECCDPGAGVSHDDDTTYANTAASGDAEVMGLTGDVNFNESMIAVTSVIIYCRARRTDTAGDNAIRLRVRLDATNETSGDLTLGTSYSNHTFDVTSSRPTGGTWTEADFRNAGFRWDVIRTANGPPTRVTSLWVEIVYVAASALVGPSRRVVSRRLRLMRKPLSIVEIDTPNLEFLNRRPGDIVGLSHFATPHETNTGAQVGIEKWERVPHLLLGRVLNLDALQVRLKLADARDFLLSLWDTGISNLSASSQRDGIAALDAGAARTFSRDSGAWVEDPGDGRIVEISAQDEKNTASGFLLEQSATNTILNSCNDDGVSSDWNTQNTGVNGSAVADDTTDTFWDTDVTAQSIKITAGSPLGGSPVGIHQTTASYDADSVITVSVTHKDDSAEQLEVEIQRGFDSEYWTGSAWQAGQTTNVLTVRSSATRDQINNIDVGGDATTIKVTLTAEDVAGQINHVYDGQCEATPYATSRILTNGAAITREDDALTYSNDDGTRVMYPDRGTGFVRVIPGWSTADLPADSFRAILSCQYDSDNWDWVGYKQASGGWMFWRKANGTVYIAAKATTVTKGTSYDIAWRWTSDEGELGLPNYTISIFVDSVKGADLETEAIVPVDDANMELGRTSSDSQMLDCWISHLFITPLVYTDQRIARLP